MASFWFWFIVIIGSTIAGALGFLILYGISIFFRDTFFLKRGIPKNKKKVTEFIKNNPDKFGGYKHKENEENSKLNQEQEVQNERREREKFREFEKLRRAELKSRVGGSETSELASKGNEPIQRRELLSNEPNPSSTSDSGGSKPTKPRVKLDS